VLDHAVQSLAFVNGERLVASTIKSIPSPGVRKSASDLTVVDLATGKASTAWTRPDRPMRFMVSPDGTWAASTSYLSRVVTIQDVSSGRVVHEIECKTGNIVRAAFSADGRFLCTAGMPNEVAVWDVKSGARVHQYLGPAHYLGVTSMCVSRDGELLTAAVSPPGGAPELWTFRPKVEPRRIAAQMPIVNALECDPDGRRIAAYSEMDSSIRVIDAETGLEAIVLRGYPSLVRSMAFRPDGRKLIAGYKDGRVVVWDLDADADR
jgi:WD40 repeat protein